MPVTIMTPAQVYITIAIVAVCTIFTRFSPFVLFPEGKRVPKYVRYLGNVLPYASMGMLAVYCLKSTNLFAAPYGAPEILAVLFVACLHIWRKNMLLSVGAGTLFYMLLLRLF